MLIKSSELEKQIKEIRNQISKLPRGKLVCARNGTYYKWYRSTGKKNSYISKKNRYLAQQLAWKTYLTHLLEDKLKEKNAIQLYLNHYPNSPKTEKILMNPEYRNLLETHFKPLEEELDRWVHETYEKNPKYPEHLVHQSCSGNYVRSKSECMIDTMLYTKRIPFRYECALELGGIVLYPDFTIRHPRTGKVYYWEHFGKMDLPDYAQNTFSKLQLYNAHGIIPSRRLITTYETKENPLSSNEIAKVIENYFN